MKVLIDLDMLNKEEAHVKGIGFEIGRRLALIDYFLGFEPIEIDVYETRNGFHIYIEMEHRSNAVKEECPELIVALQLILMSDYKREIMNLRRIIERRHAGLPLGEWNLLFVHKNKGKDDSSAEKKTELSKVLGRYIMMGYETQYELL